MSLTHSETTAEILKAQGYATDLRKLKNKIYAEEENMLMTENRSMLQITRITIPQVLRTFK